MKELNCTKNQQFELFSTIAKKVDSFSIEELQSMKMNEMNFKSFSEKFYSILYKGDEWENSITKPLKRLFNGFPDAIPDHFNSFRDFLLKNNNVGRTELCDLRESLNSITRIVISEKAEEFESRFDKSVVKSFAIDFQSLFGKSINYSAKERKELLTNVLNNLEDVKIYSVDKILKQDDIKKLVSNKWFQEIILKLQYYLEEWDSFISNDEAKLKLVFETKKEEFCFVQEAKPGSLLIFDFENEFNSLIFFSSGIFNLFSKNSEKEEFDWIKSRIDNWHKALQDYILDLDKLTFFSYVTNKVPLFVISDGTIQKELLYGGLSLSDCLQLFKQIEKEDKERIKEIISKTLSL